MATLSPEDIAAVAGLADRLGVPAGSLGGLIELESGFDPNVWGGAGGNYRGLIQFGPGARQEVGLPDTPMSIAEQVPFVEKYFQQRGFKPGEHGVREMYRTVLVGNPYESGTDSFGTNSDKAAARMMPGGDLYERAMARLGGATGGGGSPGYTSSSSSGGGGGGGSSTSAILSELDDIESSILDEPYRPLRTSGQTPLKSIDNLRRAGSRRFGNSVAQLWDAYDQAISRPFA